MNPSWMHARSVRGSLLALLASTALLSGCSSSSGGGLQPPAGIHYADATPTYTANAPVTPDVPSVSGGAVSTWSVLPGLPTGLSLDSATGVITGTPTTPSAAAIYVVTAANAAGSATAGLTITVTQGVTPPSGLTYLNNPVVYTAGQAIQPNTPSTSGGQPTSYSVGPSLPSGLNLDTATGIISGTPTGPTQQATYTVQASNSGGPPVSVGLVITVSNSPQPIETFGYTSNSPSYVAGTPVQNAPTFTGGTPTSYAVDTLPAGLSLNTTTGVISGTPTTPVTAATCVVTASNSVNSRSVTLSITVTSSVVGPGTITYAYPSQSYPAGTAIPQNAPSFTGGRPTSWSVVPSLPAGLALDPNTGVITGTPTAVSAATAYTITGGNSGGTANATVTIAVTIVYGQLALVVDQVARTDTTVNVNYTAVGQGPYTVMLKAKLYQSGGIAAGDSAYINFTAVGSGIGFNNTAVTQLQCPTPVTSANPECEMLVNLAAATPPATYVVSANVAGAITTRAPPYNVVNVVLNPDATRGPGTIEVTTQAGNVLPYGMNAPVFVNWKNPAEIGTVIVNLQITGNGTFYWYTPSDNTTVQTGTSQSCTLTFTGTTGSQLSCGFGVRAIEPPTSAQTASAAITFTATGSWNYVYPPPPMPLTFTVQQPLPVTRTVQFVNQSSQPLWVGITGGGAISYVDPRNPYAPPGANAAGKPVAGSSLCGPSTTPPNASACPIGTTCIQGGQNPTSATTFQCFYDQATPSPGYYLAPAGGGAASTASIAISGSSLSPQGIIWSGNFYGRTGCSQAGTCENATCVGSTANLACGPGTGPSPGVNTLAEATFQAGAQPDYYDVSIINGANFAMQFFPTVTGSQGYNCGMAGSTQAQAGGLGAAGWTMNVGTQNFPTPLLITGDPATYYRTVSSSATQTCNNTAGTTQANGCASFPGTVCGFRISDLTGTFDVATRYCGAPVGWVTADAIYGFVRKATTFPSNPFYFLTNPSGPVTVGHLQACTGSTYSSYIQNWPGPVQQVALACGGVMWGATDTVNQNPAGNVGLGITQPSQAVQTANADWLDYVLPTIKWMKQACPTCYTYPFDDMSSTFTCADSTGQGLTYTVQFSDLK